MKKVISSNYLLIILIALFLLIPENSGSLMPSIPVNNISELLIVLLVLAIALHLRSHRKELVIFFAIFIFLKIILLIQPTNMWSLCYQDDLARRSTEEIGQSIDNEYACEKIYQFNVEDKSSFSNQINYYSKPQVEWLGANGSNFELGFFNNKKFNHKSNGELDRRWLPFSLTISKTFSNEISSLKIEYLGDLEIYRNNVKIYEGRNYLNENLVEINNISNNNLEISYKFEKNEGNEVRLRAENPRDYPPDRYAKLKILDSNSQIYKTEKNNVTIFVELIFIGLIIYNLFFLISRQSKQELSEHFHNKKIVVAFYLVLTYLIFSPGIIKLFPVLFIVDSFTIFIYLTTFLIFYNYDLEPIEIFLICLAVTYLLMDLDFKQFNEYIRPGGSDSLTYEYFSRIILEGSFFQGGEDVYTYSPGARYFVFFSHVIFGEKLKYFFIFLNALSAYLLIISKNVKVDKNNIFIYLGFIYLTSNSINRIFYFGMSEIFSLVLILIYFKSEKLKTSYPVLSGVILGMALINRPILALGLLAIVIACRNVKVLFSFCVVSLLPLMHNLIYGNKPTIFTEDWNYQGNVLGESLGYKEQVLKIIDTISINFHYVVMNPLYEDVYMRVGRLLPLIFALSVILFFLVFYRNKSELNISNELIKLLPIILFVAPFAVYNPIYFYPRFLLIPHIVFIIYCQNLKNEYS